MDGEGADGRGRGEEREKEPRSKAFFFFPPPNAALASHPLKSNSATPFIRRPPQTAPARLVAERGGRVVGEGGGRGSKRGGGTPLWKAAPPLIQPPPNSPILKSFFGGGKVSRLGSGSRAYSLAPKGKQVSKQASRRQTCKAEPSSRRGWAKNATGPLRTNSVRSVCKPGLRASRSPRSPAGLAELNSCPPSPFAAGAPNLGRQAAGKRSGRERESRGPRPQPDSSHPFPAGASITAAPRRARHGIVLFPACPAGTFPLWDRRRRPLPLQKTPPRPHLAPDYNLHQPPHLQRSHLKEHILPS
ncbi:uncharacterized protein LOC131204124 isoform X2 [Ahaetulla prasina]|uniref:uncharacterized protein LOC131204124 isoform X2 n=1 Tax=Ahaetulla prasina TaxID=499056 RepID=UPI0026484607|nr:uncharacterized protein LOC131204124 isoform X2 [Ahaetulla prasina]